MSDTTLKLHPYLFFAGNCREAMEFYREIFGGELTITTFGDGPKDAHADPKANSEEMKHKVMHAALKGDVTILASDDPNALDSKSYGQFGLSLEGTNEPIMNEWFEKLSKEGQVTSPLQKQFWGDTFGMVTDKFKINWLFSIKK